MKAEFIQFIANTAVCALNVVCWVIFDYKEFNALVAGWCAAFAFHNAAKIISKP